MKPNILCPKCNIKIPTGDILSELELPPSVSDIKKKLSNLDMVAEGAHNSYLHYQQIADSYYDDEQRIISEIETLQEALVILNG